MISKVELIHHTTKYMSMLYGKAKKTLPKTQCLNELEIIPVSAEPLP